MTFRRLAERGVAPLTTAGGCENGVVERTAGFFPTGRSRGVTVAVDGFFAFVWFGWGQAAAPSWLVVPLAVGSALAVPLAAAGVVMAARAGGRLLAMTDPVVRRRYGVIVGAEFGLLGVGAAVLGAAGRYPWVAAWICFGVGVHFFPLAWALRNPSLRPLGVLLVAVAAAALAAGLATTVAPSTITGPGAGLCLLAFGLATLLADGTGRGQTELSAGGEQAGGRRSRLTPVHHVASASSDQPAGADRERGHGEQAEDRDPGSGRHRCQAG